MDFKIFSERIERVNNRIDEILVGKPETLYEAARHLSSAGGKRIRPLLCLLSCESVGGNPDNAIDTAVSMELIHTFTLIHDDIMDNDELRRGIPSVHVKFGESTAILAGDLLFSKAFELCGEGAVKILARASSEICEGQEMDISFEKINSLSENEYLEMIIKKTAKLFEASTWSGAVVGKGSNEEIENLANFGLNMGIAFQIQDDILDLIADEEKLGKPVGSDIIEGKKTLIAIKAINNTDGIDRDKLIEILMKKNNTIDEIEFALNLFRDSGALEQSRKMADEFIAKAKNSLKNLAESDAKKHLLDIADFVIDRNK